MKKTITIISLAVLTLIGSSAFIVKNSTGITGYAGSPGEGTCSNCHSGGSSASSGLTITSVPAFSLNANLETEYMPDSTYQIIIEAQASGFTRYGFASQILDASNINAGIINTPGAGVKFLNAGSKRTAVHNSIKTAAGTATFTYKWTAPGFGEATIYAIGNAVNGNGSYFGDFVISPINMPLVAGAVPTPSNDVGLKNHSNAVTQIRVFPNPASDLTTISYYLGQPKTITVELLDIKGATIKNLYEQYDSPGLHSRILNLQGVASGVYFIKTSADKEKVSQKLITVQ